MRKTNCILIIVAILGILFAFSLFNKEGIVLGVMAKMFTIAGPIIVTGISSSVLVGIIYWIIGVV